MSSRLPARPWVSANFAVTWDGRISTRNRTPSTFSSKRDKRRLLELRAEADAVLAGAGTVAADRMTMGLPVAELRAARQARGQAPYPVRALLSNSGRIDPALRLFAENFSPVVIFSTRRMPRRTQAAFQGKADLRLTLGERVDLPAMLQTLRSDYAVTRIDCEGGGQVFRSLLEAGLVDELHLTLCPRLFGGIKAPTLTGLAGRFLPRSVCCSLKSMEVADGECFLRYLVHS
jgi:riboflavin-specific deaminase-like protein